MCCHVLSFFGVIYGGDFGDSKEELTGQSAGHGPKTPELSCFLHPNPLRDKFGALTKTRGAGS